MVLRIRLEDPRRVHERITLQYHLPNPDRFFPCLLIGSR